MATKRISKKVVSGVTAEEFNEAMGAFAAADARRCRLLAKMDEEVTKVRDKYQDELSGLEKECETQQEVIQTYCEENKEALFNKKRSMDTSHGSVGFRFGTPKLKLLPKMNWVKVLDNLKAYLPSYVRTTEEPAKDRLIIDRELPEVTENLKKVGLMVDNDEKFFIELKKEEMAAV